MNQKQEKITLTKAWINIPKKFLKQFDTQTKNSYSSRNEAIRYGMKLVLQEITNYKTNKPTKNPGNNPPSTITDKQQSTGENL
ncbi:MAG: ribbon-helix-helix domain-containing protein [Nitrososphaerota archaeon]|nr:ribbon-helix-helix domain-containing protein [Nitrososphaerota archaeon]